MALTRLPAASITGSIAKARFPSGTIIQTITDTFTDQSTTSNSFSNFKTMSITKTSSSNNVIIQISSLWKTDSPGSGWSGGSVRVQRNADSGGATNLGTTDFLGGEGIPNWIHGSLGNTFIDTGSGTSISYTFDIKKSSGATAFAVGGSHFDADGESNYISIREIVG